MIQMHTLAAKGVHFFGFWSRNRGGVQVSPKGVQIVQRDRIAKIIN